MKKVFWFLLVLILSHSISSAQFSGTSKTVDLNLSKPYIRGLPPNIFVELQFVDDNANGLLEAEENARLILKIKNEGSGPAQGLQISLKSNVSDPELQIEPSKLVRLIKPGETKVVEMKIKAGFFIKTNQHKIDINITEHFGFDMDQATLNLNTYQYIPSKLVFIGMDIYDQGEGTGSVIKDGNLQAGEQIRAKLVVQNIGQNLALGVSYKFVSNDSNIYVNDFHSAIGDLGDFKVGETKEIWVTISPNKRVKVIGKLPLFLTVTEKKNYGNIKEFQIPLELEKRAPKPAVLSVKADMAQIQKQVARIEYKSDKFSFNNSNVKNIESPALGKIKRNKSIGIVIGVENYTNLPKAPFASHDAEIIEKYFKLTLGVEQVITYTNQQVSGLFFKSTFDPSIGKLTNMIDPGKTDLFVYYSGHGVPDRNGDEVYLFPSDGSINLLKEGGYSINNFYESLNKLNAKSVTVIMDACFSGSTRANENLTGTKALGIKVKDANVRPWETNPNFRVFSSSSNDETSLGYDASQSGLYTYFLCVGLQGEADTNKDRKITVEELQNYLVLNVNDLAKKLSSGKSQTPLFFGAPGMVLTEY
jgi:hypothetical protein